MRGETMSTCTKPALDERDDNLSASTATATELAVDDNRRVLRVRVELGNDLDDLLDIREVRTADSLSASSNFQSAWEEATSSPP